MGTCATILALVVRARAPHLLPGIRHPEIVTGFFGSMGGVAYVNRLLPAGSESIRMDQAVRANARGLIDWSHNHLNYFSNRPSTGWTNQDRYTSFHDLVLSFTDGYTNQTVGSLNVTKPYVTYLHAN